MGMPRCLVKKVDFTSSLYTSQLSHCWVLLAAFYLAARKLTAVFQHCLKLLRCSSPRLAIFVDGSHMFNSKRLAYFFFCWKERYEINIA